MEHVFCQILRNEQRDLRCLKCDNYEKIQDGIAVTRWSRMKLIKKIAYLYLRLIFIHLFYVTFYLGFVDTLLRAIFETFFSLGV